MKLESDESVWKSGVANTRVGRASEGAIAWSPPARAPRMNVGPYTLLGVSLRLKTTFSREVLGVGTLRAVDFASGVRLEAWVPLVNPAQYSEPRGELLVAVTVTPPFSDGALLRVRDARPSWQVDLTRVWHCGPQVGRDATLLQPLQWLRLGFLLPTQSGLVLSRMRLLGTVLARLPVVARAPRW